MFPGNLSELLDMYIGERINWINDWSLDSYEEILELKAWAEAFAREYELSAPRVRWTIYLEEE